MSQMQSMETAKGLPALRAKSEPGEQELRQQLREAQETHRAADARARLAAEAEGRAAAALATAQTEVTRLEAQQKRASDAATEKHAKIAMDALRANSPVPAATTIPDSLDTACLAAAKAQAAALEAAHRELAAEHTAARAEAGRASDAVAKAADAVLECEAHALAAELIACCELYWQLAERFDAFSLLDEHRQGGPKLDTFRREIRHKTDRRAMATAEHPKFVEMQTWQEHLAGRMAAQERRWQEHRLALMADAQAQWAGQEGAQ